MADDLETQLASIDAAIQSVMAGGQKRQIRGRMVEYPSLESLQAQRNIIAARINARLPKTTYFRRRRG